MTIRLFRACAATTTVLAMIPAALASATPTAQEIVAKTRAAMRNVKTYQATVQTTMSGGPMSMTMNAHVKTANGKAWAQIGVVPAGGQQNAFASMFQNMIVVDDGKNTWTYIPAMKQYRKGPSGGAKQLNMSGEFLKKVGADSNLALTGSETVAGRPTYIIEARPKKPRPGQPQMVRVNIDKASYRVVQVRVVQSRPASGQRPASQNSVQVLVKDEKVNQPIPASLFHFTPPPGATEMQAGMGMRPGVGGGRPAPRK
jgi:outer membrane lipoprotein-sorting protein